MRTIKTRWIVLAVVVSVVGLGLVGRRLHREMPPIPATVVAQDGRILFTRDDIETGREVWRTMAGQQQGSIWGHGAYLTPDWSADWLHRELVFILDRWATRDFGNSYDALSSEQKVALRDRLQAQLRNNRVDAATGELRVPPDRAEAIRNNQIYYLDLFGDAPEYSALRAQYAMPENPIPDEARRQALTAFIFWTAWATTTNRPGETATYTLNWPHEPLVGNVATTEAVAWSVASCVALIGIIGLMMSY